MPTPIAEGPWQGVGTDLFQLENKDYLIVTDYYCRFFEVAKVENTKSVIVIQYLQSIFTRHGISFEVESDNGPQFSLREFKDFSKKWCYVKSAFPTSQWSSQTNSTDSKTYTTQDKER